jgi:hypothetical protein
VDICIRAAYASGWPTGISIFKSFVNFRKKRSFIVGQEKGGVGEGGGEPRKGVGGPSHRYTTK